MCIRRFDDSLNSVIHNTLSGFAMVFIDARAQGSTVGSCPSFCAPLGAGHHTGTAWGLHSFSRKRQHAHAMAAPRHEGAGAWERRHGTVMILLQIHLRKPCYNFYPSTRGPYTLLWSPPGAVARAHSPLPHLDHALTQGHGSGLQPLSCPTLVPTPRDPNSGRAPNATVGPVSRTWLCTGLPYSEFPHVSTDPTRGFRPFQTCSFTQNLSTDIVEK